LPFAVDQLGRVLEATLTVSVFTDRGALGAMRTLVERVIESRLLPCPDAILNFGDDAATDRTMRTDRLDLLGIGAGRIRGLGLLHHDRRHRGRQRRASRHQARIAQKCAACYRAGYAAVRRDGSFSFDSG